MAFLVFHLKRSLLWLVETWRKTLASWKRLVLWNLMFYMCSFVHVRFQGTLTQIFGVFLSFSVLLLLLWCSVPQIPAASLPQTLFFFPLSLLGKTASCSAVLMILPCGKCDHSVAYLICLFSFIGHSPALHIVCCLTIIVSVFSPVV